MFTDILKRTGVIMLLLFLVPAFCATAQEVTGNVTDETGEPLPGVTVLIKGTTVGVSTDLDGNFSIRVEDPATTVLSFSYVGMEKIDVAVRDRTNLDIILKSKTEYLDEIVVIGYGSVRKRDLTGAVSSVNSEQLKDMPATSTAAAITGRLAGVHVVTAEGSPDAEVKVRVRGGGSITQDNSPLFIIDGFPQESMSDIPPSDIASIDVLKDASSTAIYGARGANGVIIITTKGGSAGKVKVEYNFFGGFRDLSSKLPVLNPYDFVLNQYERAIGSYLDLRSFTNLFGEYEQLDSLYSGQTGTDWQQEVFGRLAPVFNHNLSILGGSEKATFNLSLSHINDQGIMIGAGYVRSNVNFRFESRATEKLTINFDARLSNTKISGAGTSDPGTSTNNRLRHAVIYRPVNGLYDFSDDPDLEFDEDEYYDASRLIDPVTLINDEYRRRYRTYATLNGSLRYKIIKNLEFRTDLGFDYRPQRYARFDGVSTPNARKYGEKPIVILEENRDRSLRWANTLSYDLRKYNDAHDINVLLGHEMINNDYTRFSAESRSFPEDITAEVAIGSMELGEDNQKPETFEGLNRLMSFFGRANYGYKDRYLASFTVRADGSSKFGPKNRWGIFPSGSFAWRISEEAFMQSIDFISNLKARISYGQAGNNRITDFLWTTTYNVGSDKAFYVNNVPLTFLYPANLANPNLKWETTITRNIGLDVGFFNSRLNLTLDAYNNTTRDLLIQSRIPSVSGYEEQMQNIGQTTNYGLEMILDAYIIERDEFHLSSNFNISFNRNRVDDLGGMESFSIGSGWSNDTGDDYLVMVDNSVGLMYGFVSDGFYTVDDFNYDPETETYTLKPGVADNSGITFGGNLVPGMMKFKDINKPVDENGNPLEDDHTVTFDEDRVIIGNSNPKHLGGLNIMGVYKGFDMSVFVNWVYGNNIYNANKIEFTSNYRKYTNALTDISSDKRWRSIDDETGEIVTDPVRLADMNKDASIWTPTQGRYLFHSWAVEDGSFLRINNITLGYTFPSNWTNRVFIQRFRVYATLNNLHTFTKYSGYDPEVDTRRGTPLTPGVDYSAYPRSTSYIFGLNLSF